MTSTRHRVEDANQLTTKMADCGATGTALDRTARAVFSDPNASKHVAALIGHMGLSSVPMGLETVPDTVSLGNPTVMSSHSKLDSVSSPVHELRYSDPLQHRHQPSMHPAMAQQQHMMAMMAQQQHQMQAMVAMQQQHHQQQQARARLDQSQETAWQDGLDQATKQALREHLAALDEDVATVGHEGIVHDQSFEALAAAWAQAENEISTTRHEEVTQDPSIETLSAAWAQAEEDYRNTFEVEDAVNLASTAQHVPQTYEFINTERPVEPDRDWMADGQRHFAAGNIRQAIHAFEMELQHKDGDNATAWRMLGRCHAENDMDVPAIACLEQAIERDPFSPETLLALGVSCVNELQHEKALQNLKAWITHNSEFAGLELPADDLYSDGSSQLQPLEHVQRLLLGALDHASEGTASVLEALGVVYNVSRDYDAAVDAFRRALQERPNDYQLWNKLGATLANSGESEKALSAYHEALQRKPKYARAWLNLAISHSNLNQYDEAARCYLQTLSLNPSAVHCWSYLRIALSSMERWDLLSLVSKQDVGTLHEHFDFVTYT